MPSPTSAVSRRRVLAGAAALTLLGIAACGRPAPRPDVDAMTTELERARADADLASRAAPAARPPSAAALTVVAAERTAHAQALTDELTRMLGAPPTPPPAASSTTTTSAPPPKPPTVADVIAALKQSADAAGKLAAEQSGYRAGLLGSIAASCTAAGIVALGGDDQ